MSITYSVRRAGDATVVDLTGRIGFPQPMESGSGSGVVLHKLVRDLVDHGQKGILFSLREVASVDSSGIGELFGCYTTVRNHGGVLKLTEPNERVRNVLRLTKLDSVVDLIQDEASAVRSFSKGEQSLAAGK